MVMIYGLIILSLDILDGFVYFYPISLPKIGSSAVFFPSGFENRYYRRSKTTLLETATIG